MKKLASAATAILLGVIMALSCLVTVSAADTPTEADKGSIKLTKYNFNTDGEPVENAEFSAYRILNFDGKTYTVNEKFAGQVNVSDVVNVSASQAGTLSYGSTTELEAQITKLQNFIQTSETGQADYFNGTGESATNPAVKFSATTGADGIATIGKDADDNNTLPLGVYLVQETRVPIGYTVTTQAFLVAIPQWNQGTDGTGSWQYDITATPKDELLKVDKQMKDPAQGTDTNTTQADSYSIGDTIPYVVTVKIPNYGKAVDNDTVTVTDDLLIKNVDSKGKDKYNALNLTFTDTLSKGLTLNLDSLVIKVLEAGESGADVPLTKGTTLAELESFTVDQTNVTKTAKSGEGVGDYTAESTTVGDATQMTINIAWASLDQYQGKTIQLTYSAQLNENAEVGNTNTNTVEYKFSNDPQQVMGETASKTRTTDTDNVYTYQMDLTKKFNGEAADGTIINASTVEFELTTVVDTAGNKVDAPTQLKFIKETTNGHYTVWNGVVDNNKAYSITDTTKTTSLGNVVTKLNPDNEGHLYVKGLEAGTYELKETKSLNGYTILTEPVTILVKEVEEGNPAVVTQKVTAYTMKWSDTDGKAVEKDELANADESGIFTITINNAKSQFYLPVTGGLGLWMFTIGGGIVMAGAIIFFSVIRKKKSKKV